MAGEVTHVVYAARILPELRDAVQDDAYWIGNLFPDIRHFGIVSRHRTHPQDITKDELVGEDEFQTGMRVHAWVDMLREQHLRNQHIKETLPWHPFVPHALKLVEDELLYDEFEDWEDLRSILEEVREQELEFVDDRERIQEWHNVLQAYFAKKPDDEARLELSRAIGLSDASAQELNSIVQQLRQHDRIEPIVEGFRERVEQELA